MDDDKPSLEDIAHFGIKGMKWGVRRSTPQVENSRYSQNNRALDKNTFGKRGVSRINSRMNDGKSYKQAVRREFARTIGKGALFAGAGVSILLLDAHGPKLAATIAAKAEANRGRAAALSLMTPLVAKNRRGVYKITTM